MTDRRGVAHGTGSVGVSFCQSLSTSGSVWKKLLPASKSVLALDPSIAEASFTQPLLWANAVARRIELADLIEHVGYI